MRLGLFALLRKIRRVPSCGREADVALASPAAFGYKLFLALAEHIGNDRARLLVLDDGALGHLYNDVRTAFAEAFVRAAAFAVAREIFAYISERKQVVYVLVRNDIDVSAVSAVAAVGSARGLALV